MKKYFILLSFLTIASYACATFSLESLGGSNETDLNSLFARKFQRDYIIPDWQESLYLRVTDRTKTTETPRERVFVLDFVINSSSENFTGVYPQLSFYNTSSVLFDYFWNQIHGQLGIPSITISDNDQFSIFSAMRTLLPPKEFSKYLDMESKDGENENRYVYFKLLENVSERALRSNSLIVDELMKSSVSLEPILFGLPREIGLLSLQLSSINVQSQLPAKYQELPRNKRGKNTHKVKTKESTVRIQDVHSIEFTDPETIKDTLSEMFGRRIEDLFEVFNPENQDNSTVYN